MNKEIMILGAIWIICLIGMVTILRSNKKHKAIVAFLFSQALFWIHTLWIVNLKLIDFPVRILPKATDLSITTDYLLYPFLCMVYIRFEPRDGKKLNIPYLVLFTFVVAMIDSLLESFTDIILYIHYNWFFTWVSLLIIFGLTKRYCSWFFNSKQHFN